MVGGKIVSGSALNIQEVTVDITYEILLRGIITPLIVDAFKDKFLGKGPKVSIGNTVRLDVVDLSLVILIESFSAFGHLGDGHLSIDIGRETSVGQVTLGIQRLNGQVSIVVTIVGDDGVDKGLQSVMLEHASDGRSSRLVLVGRVEFVHHA